MTIRPLRLLLLLVLTAVPSFATDRLVSISAPSETRPGSPVHVSVMAETDATDGEQIGFMHAQYSVDGGKSWTAICFEEKVGAQLERGADFQAGAAGTKILVRVRVAFRGGKAGDVTYKGTPIAWDESWGNYRAPAGKFVVIYVR
jgi:hypothetical protein